MTTGHQRLEMAAVMDYLHHVRDRIHYPPVIDHVIKRTETIHEIRTLVQVHERVERKKGLTIDCSQGVTLICLVAGLKNPNGSDTDGYTGTLLANLPHYYSPHSAMIGALVVFGGGTGHHVAMVREPGADPLLFSQGQESDPRLIRLSQERLYQPPPVTFLSIAKLG